MGDYTLIRQEKCPTLNPTGTMNIVYPHVKSWRTSSYTSRVPIRHHG